MCCMFTASSRVSYFVCLHDGSKENTKRRQQHAEQHSKICSWVINGINKSSCTKNEKGNLKNKILMNRCIVSNVFVCTLCVCKQERGRLLSESALNITRTIWRTLWVLMCSLSRAYTFTFFWNMCTLINLHNLGESCRACVLTHERKSQNVVFEA